jgi:hypothetical protein
VPGEDGEGEKDGGGGGEDGGDGGGESPDLLGAAISLRRLPKGRPKKTRWLDVSVTGGGIKGESGFLAGGIVARPLSLNFHKRPGVIDPAFFHRIAVGTAISSINC